MAVVPTLRHAPPLPGHTLTASSTTAPLGAVGMTIERERAGSACGRDLIASQPSVSGRSKDPNHDAVMRIGSEAPKRRTHSSIRHESQGTCRDSATSNRHRRLVTSERTRPKLWGYFQRPPFIGPDAKRHRPAQRPAARAATGRSEACAPRLRSSVFEYRERSRCELETTAPKRCSSGAKGTATPIESCLAGLQHCPNGPVLSPAFPPAFVGRASEASITALWPVGRACFATAPRAPACRPSRCRPQSRAPIGAPWRAVHHQAPVRSAPGALPRSAGSDC